MVCFKVILWISVLAVYVGADMSQGDIEVSMTPNNYGFSFETENGQVRDENVEVDPDSNPKSAEPETEVNVKGSYSFISADGYEYSVHYKAGKKGYQPYVTAHKIKADSK